MCRLRTATISIQHHKNLAFQTHTVADLNPRITCLSPILTIERLLQMRLPTTARQTIHIVHGMGMEEHLHPIDTPLI